MYEVTFVGGVLDGKRKTLRGLRPNHNAPKMTKAASLEEITTILQSPIEFDVYLRTDISVGSRGLVFYRLESLSEIDAIGRLLDYYKQVPSETPSRP